MVGVRSRLIRRICKDRISIGCRRSARISWTCAGPSSLARGARKVRRRRRRQGVQRRSKASARTAGSLCLCSPLSPSKELGLSRLSGGGHSPPHTVSTQAPRTGSTQLHTSSPRGPTFGPRVEGTLGQGMSQPSPSAAPKLDLDTGGRSQKPQSQRDEPREGNSTWNNMPTLAGLLSPRNTVKEVSMAERCSSHCKLEEGNRNEVTAEACSTQVGEDSCLKAHLLEAETGGFQGPAIAMMDRMGGEVENGHASLEAANMSKWKTLLDAVGERLDGGVVSQFTPSTMWVDALDKERPSGLPSGEEDAQIELGSVLRFLKKDWLLDGRRRSDSGAMTELLGGAKPTNRWTLYPNGRQRLIWDVLGCLLLLHDLIMIPMVVFDSRTTGMPAGYKNFETIFQFASASFWTLDIFVSFITGFHSSEGFVEMDPYKVARNYIKSWLCLDLVIVAVDWSSIFVSNLGDASDSLRLGKTASRIMRVFRLLRFAKMNTHMQDMMNMVNSEYIQQLMGLLKLLVAIVIVNHYVACFWFLVAATNPSGGVTWAMNAFGGGQWSMIYAYTTCLHWSLTQFTPASMEVVPENEVERTFNIVVIIMALVIFSSFVSSITSTMTHIRNINDYKTKQEAAVRGFFTEHQIPAKLVSRVWHFIKHHRRTVKKRTRLQDVQAFKGLPPSVKDEIRKAMFMPILKVHPVFLEYSRIDPPALHEMLKIGTSAEPPALNEQSIQSMGGVELDRGVGEGGLVKEIVFVVRGVLDYQQSSDGQATASVGEGQWCCEAALWIAEAVLEGSLLAADGGAEVVTVHSRRFQSVAKSNPTSMPFLARYAKLFTEKLNEAQMDPDYKCVLFNCQEEIQELVDDSLKVNMGNVSLMKRANATLRKSMSRPSQ
ncbi:unnamed protein product [Prorocentrum cordatum]|uniref:Ion transport domain-containing protein n=1 Tax=Prorocentrum cordatum TaxID=2364126 RepID=A0ABN9X4E5_9DINO|nr:unnamed protein product [Polarella glacialis]